MINGSPQLEQNKLYRELIDAEPSLAVPLTDGDIPEVSNDIISLIDVVEFRLDKWAHPWDSEHIASKKRKLGRKPILATIRTAAEGGNWPVWEGDAAEGERARAGRFEDIARFVDGYDVELSSPDTFRRVVGAAALTNKVVVGSYHNFKSTPSINELEDIKGEAEDLGAHFVKFATFIRTPRQYDVIQDFTERHALQNLITVGMGDYYGPRSRIMLPRLGSRLTYASAGELQVPGQMSVEDTRRALQRQLSH